MSTAAGTTLTPESNQASATSCIGTAPATSDMLDSEDEVAAVSQCSSLKGALQTLKETVWPDYEKSDQAARRDQRHHWRLTLVAASSGSVAIVMAILQLSGISKQAWPKWGELVALSAALLALLAGGMLAKKTLWLVRRHRSERFRLLKFRAILHPDLWCGRQAQWRDRVRQECLKISQAAGPDVQTWAHDDKIPAAPAGFSQCRLNPEALSCLAGYYLRKRLGYQQAFFDQRAAEHHQRDKWWRWAGSLCFYLSVAAALGHFAVELATDTAHGLSHNLIILAAVFPVLGAGIRTVRFARESARTGSLYQAKATALRRLSEGLKEMEPFSTADPQAVLGQLWLCERFLEAEQREWLRLMLEAEWYG